MKEMQVPGELLGDVVLSRKAITVAEKRLAEKIIMDYAGTVPIVMCVKEGAKYFFDDLCKLLNTADFAYEKAWIATSSYEKNTSSGKVRIGSYEGPSVKRRRVIVVEDIIDTALTIRKLMDHLTMEGAHSVDACTLLFKKRPQNLFWRLMGLRACLGMPRIRYVGAFIPDKFVVGKGLDYDGYGRIGEAVRILPLAGQAWVDEQNR